VASQDLRESPETKNSLLFMTVDWCDPDETSRFYRDNFLRHLAGRMGVAENPDDDYILLKITRTAAISLNL
jgi:hypothetical protein